MATASMRIGRCALPRFRIAVRGRPQRCPGYLAGAWCTGALVLTQSSGGWCAPPPTVAIPCVGLDAIRSSNAEGDNSLAGRIDEAFGPEGPGVICVTGEEVRARVRQIRSEFLPQAVALADLPAEARGRLTDPDSPLTNGLSRGSEVTDRAKSSFYYHPVTDTPGDHLAEGAPRNPIFHTPNLFPSEEELPGFKAAARESAQYVVGVGHELARAIDRRLERVPGYVRGAFVKAIRVGPDSNHKCRLIRYHPYESEEELAATKGMWAAPHLDTGSLTGLVPGVYVDAGGRPGKSADPSAGLYIVDRRGSARKAELPAGESDVLLFQIGEGLQIVSGGELQATPHFVQGPATVDPQGIGRCSLAIFMQPQPHEELPLPAGMTPVQVAARSADRHLPPEWPTLEMRFKKLEAEGLLGPGKPLTFGNHGYATFSSLGATSAKDEL